tara:strand:- start:313 stop:507 length:195 start_codon:yes stop_codon:yes gene_type:complete
MQCASCNSSKSSKIDTFKKVIWYNYGKPEGDWMQVDGYIIKKIMSLNKLRKSIFLIEDFIRIKQ